MTIIDCKGITKTFRTGLVKNRFTALDDVDLEIQQGEIFGILGPNGAGKTTLLKIILGLIFPDEGAVTIFSKDVKDHTSRSKVGYLPEAPNLPPYLTAKQTLELFGKLSGVPSEEIKTRTAEILTEVKMDKWADKKTSTFSKGMVQRLGLAQALVSEPDLIFLDEPTDGVDPIGRKEIRDILQRLKQQGKTIFLNSHLLSETEMICDRVAIMDKGKIVAVGGIEDMTLSLNSYRIKCKELPNGIADKLQGIARVKTVENGTIDALVENLEGLNRVIDVLRSENIIIESISQNRQSLESYFVDLITDLRGEEV